MKNQFATLLADIGFVSGRDPVGLRPNSTGTHLNLNFVSQMSAESNVHSHNQSLIKAVLCAALYPRVIR